MHPNGRSHAHVFSISHQVARTSTTIDEDLNESCVKEARQELTEDVVQAMINEAKKGNVDAARWLAEHEMLDR